MVSTRSTNYDAHDEAPAPDLIQKPSTAPTSPSQVASSETVTPASTPATEALITTPAPMAPVSVDAIEEQLKATIQQLYNISVAIHGYQGDASSEALMGYVKNLAGTVATLPANSASLPTMIPPEIIAYVDDGRNPDIYTREFVELVQKSNQFLKGRGEAFAKFRDILAEDIIKGFPELQEDVQKILDNAKGTVEEGGSST
ncbi:MAG: RNA polymerase II mediator complex subunit [Vezdaea acicularis]|nr:MAG: RNA polymerase II mediator complex subunit [Vezdaea acicularis]